MYTLGVEQGNQLQVIDELLGIDSEFLFNFEKYQYVTQNRKISETIQSLDDNLPDVLDTIYKITNNSDSILTELEKTGYITSAQKIEMLETFSNIEKHLLSIEKSVSYMMMARGLPFSNKKAMEVAIDLSSYNEIVKEFDSIKKEIKDLQDSDELKDLVKLIGESHGITELLESLHLESDVDGQKYIGSEFYLKSTEGSEEIWVSLTATGKMCGLGKMNLTKKEEMVETFKKALEEKVYEVFEFQRLRARVAIDYMESNPNIDRKFLHPHGFSESFNRTITRMNVHEEIPRFEDTTLDMTQQITNLNTSIEKGYLLIEQFRDSIEKLFSEEAKIAEKIDFLEEVYNGD